MVRINDIQDKLLHLIGWQQSYDGSDLKISDALTTSESGLYFQQVHPLLTLQNLACIAPDFKNMMFAEYDPTVDYTKGGIVSYGGTMYKALQDVPRSVGPEDSIEQEDPTEPGESSVPTSSEIGVDEAGPDEGQEGTNGGEEDPEAAEVPGAPDTNHEFWVETNLFSEWLEDKTKSSIQKAIIRFCNEKMAQGTYKALCENRTLFDGTGRLSDVVKNRKNLVGFEIVPIRSKGVTTKINRIGLQFTEPGEYTLYLMHSSMDEPVRKISVNKTKSNSTEWFSFDDLYLPYQSDGNDAGGSWYLCYFQSELPEGSQAIRKDKDWSKEPCKSCSRSEYISWQAWSKYIEVHPFFVNEELVAPEEPTEEMPAAEDAVTLEETPGQEDVIVEEPAGPKLRMWDVENNQYTYDSNYGINLDITVSCDITDFIIEQRALFQDVIAKQAAVDMLREFAYNASVRTNRHSINASRVDILYEIDGDSSSMKQSGLSYQLDMAFKSIKLSTEGIDRICMPCKNNGIKYRAI